MSAAVLDALPSHPLTEPAALTSDSGSPKMEDPGPLRAAHTPNFPALLRQLGASLLVTTYQAGRLVMVRDEGDHLNTHFRAFQALGVCHVDAFLDSQAVHPACHAPDSQGGTPVSPGPGVAGGPLGSVHVQ